MNGESLSNGQNGNPPEESPSLNAGMTSNAPFQNGHNHENGHSMRASEENSENPAVPRDEMVEKVENGSGKDLRSQPETSEVVAEEPNIESKEEVKEEPTEEPMETTMSGMPNLEPVTEDIEQPAKKIKLDPDLEDNDKS